jgi:Leucine-rich repeat (LRR) protein
MTGTARASKLNTLSFSYSAFTGGGSYSLETLPVLRTLNIIDASNYNNGNNALTLSPNMFQGFSGITNLSLQNNNISSVPAGTFNGLQSLQTLNLNNNKITEIPVAAVFDGLPNLSTVDL